MTARPRRRAPHASDAPGEFRQVPVPARVLAAARRAAEDESVFAGVDVVEDFLREAQGTMPDRRDDSGRWHAWHEATSERALTFLEDGLLSKPAPF